MSATRGRLLVVDDDLVQRVLISKIGSKLGYDSVVVPSYEAATELLAREAFDVMALDLSLGERDGVELLRFVAERNLRAMAIVIISGCDDRIMKATRRVATGLKLHLGGCLTKPLDLNRLRCALELPQRSPSAASSAAPPPRITPERIARGLADHEFFVEFQPKIALRTERVVGAEALARWRTAEFGMVSPMVFIPIAEEAGLMREVTDCILSSALSQGRKLIERNPGFTIAVNISGSLMSDLTLPDRIEEILRRENVPPSSLTVEITETTAMADVDRANDILVRLRLKNIGTAIDDFGTGYSSMSLMKHFPIDTIKIDRSFVRDLPQDSEDQAIAQAIISMGKALGMTVVAEGVENAEQEAFLRAHGCDEMQGFLISKPLPAQQMAELLRPVLLPVAPPLQPEPAGEGAALRLKRAVV